jgi:hypothetical protein
MNGYSVWQTIAAAALGVVLIVIAIRRRGGK